MRMRRRHGIADSHLWIARYFTLFFLLRFDGQQSRLLGCHHFRKVQYRYAASLQRDRRKVSTRTDGRKRRHQKTLV